MESDILKFNIWALTGIVFFNMSVGALVGMNFSHQDWEIFGLVILAAVGFVMMILNLKSLNKSSDLDRKQKENKNG